MVRGAVNGHFTGCCIRAGMTGSHSAETHMSAGPRKKTEHRRMRASRGVVHRCIMSQPSSKDPCVHTKR